MTAIKKKKKRRWLRKLICWLLVLGIAAGAGYLFVWPNLTASATTTYSSYTATRGTISNSLSFSGSISVKNNETLTAESSGTVRQIYVTEEQDVSEGDRLMRLSTGETVRANFDGRINQIAVEVGDSVNTGDALVQVVDFSNMKVSLRVDEYAISDVQVGQACTVTVTALGLSFDSQLTHINRMSSSSGSTAYYTVTAELSVTGDVLPGMQVTVTIPQEEAVNAVILNKNALSFGQNNSAYVLMRGESDEDMTEVPVEIGVDNDNYVEIKAGLSEGDVVYVMEETQTDSSAVSGLLSLLGGTQMPTGGTGSTSMGGGQMPSGSGERQMPSGDFGGGSSGGGRGGFGQ